MAAGLQLEAFAHRTRTSVMFSMSRALAGFRRNASGTAMVEFGLVGMMFTLTFCFWIELGLTTFMQTALDNATRDAARLVRIGTVQSSSSPTTTFTNALCSELSVLMTCSNIKYNVVSGSSFSSLSTTITTDSSNQMTNTQFTPGSTGQDVVVQVGYTRTLYLPLVNAFLGKNGTVLLTSTVAFQNEPF